MAKKKTAPKAWEPQWSTVEKLGDGEIGRTYLVRDHDSDGLGVLKVLRDHGSAELRGRFWREATTLETLAHPRIPVLFDTNAYKHEADDLKLFLVQEYIPGTNLAAFVKAKGPMAPGAAIALGQRLIEVLSYCHEAGVGYRELEPKHILLRDDDPTDPVLVSFGRSHSDDEGVGARFLALPEHSASARKRDHRVTLTQVVGALFFAVTGLAPGALRDPEGLAPHQRPQAAETLAALSGGAGLVALFDRAFRVSVVERFQDLEELDLALAAAWATMEAPVNA